MLSIQAGKNFKSNLCFANRLKKIKKLRIWRPIQILSRTKNFLVFIFDIPEILQLTEGGIELTSNIFT